MDAFKTNIINIYGAKAKTWLAYLPRLVEDMEKKWGLSDLKPVTNLSYNYVLAGFQGSEPIMLKLGLDVAGLHREAEALRALSGFGAVKVLAEQNGALLLERAVPGTSLKVTFPKGDPRSIRIACQVTQILHKAPLPEKVFPSIRDWLKALDHCPEFISKTGESQEVTPLADYLEKARDLRDKLLENSLEPVLLHGDLHHENILHNGEDWVVIDPKGVIGSPIHEVWAFIMDFEEDTQFVADFFAFDLQEVRSWYFVHLMLAVCWNIEDRASPNFFLGLAEKVYPFV